MLNWEPPLDPPTTFADLLYHMQMTEEEYYEHLKAVEESKIDAYLAYLD